MRRGQHVTEDAKEKYRTTMRRIRAAGGGQKPLKPLIPLIDGTVQVPLTKGYVAVIDGEDASRVAKMNWYADVRSHTVYAVGTVRGKGVKISLHRFIMNSTKEVDHRDRNGLNNRRGNLRLCSSHAENNANMRVRKHCSGTPYKGIEHQTKNSWAARTKVDGRQVHIGNFPTAEQAARTYDQFMFGRFGEFALLNFPWGCTP